MMIGGRCELANGAARKQRRYFPYYDRTSNRIVIELSSKLTLSFLPPEPPYPASSSM